MGNPGAVFGETSSHEDGCDPFWNTGNRQSSSSSAEVQLSGAPEPVAKLAAERSNCWPGAELSASAQSIPQRLSDSFPAAAGWSDVVGESASDRHPLQMPLRTLVRSVLLLLWQVTDGASFSLPGSRN